MNLLHKTCSFLIVVLILIARSAQSSTYEETIAAIHPFVDVPKQDKTRDDRIINLIKQWDGYNSPDALTLLLNDFATERHRHQAQVWMFRAHDLDAGTKGDALAQTIADARNAEQRQLLIMLAEPRFMEGSSALRKRLCDALDDTSEFFDPESNHPWPVCNRAFDMLCSYAAMHDLIGEPERQSGFGVLGPSVDPEFRKVEIAKLLKIIAAHPEHFAVQKAGTQSQQRGAATQTASSDHGWLVWLLMVIAGTAGAVWVFLCKSK